MSPVALDNDMWAFRSKTDRVDVRVGGFSRPIRVYGERKVERGPDGELRFSKPEAFDSIPLRYDRAYGGCDLTALERYDSRPRCGISCAAGLSTRRWRKRLSITRATPPAAVF